MKDSIGIDISKAHLDVHRIKTGQHAQFDNNASGFHALKRWIGSEQPQIVVFEPTGPYHASFEKTFPGKLPPVKLNLLRLKSEGSVGLERLRRTFECFSD